MRCRLRTLLIGVVLTWVAAIAGAVCGGLIAQNRISSSLIPSPENVRFALAWGGVWGLIPSGFALAVLVEHRSNSMAVNRWWLCSLIELGIASGVSFYWVAVISACI